MTGIRGLELQFLNDIPGGELIFRAVDVRRMDCVDLPGSTAAQKTVK